MADEVKSALKPFYLRGEVDKEEYKDIMRRAVPKVANYAFLELHVCYCSFLQFYHNESADNCLDNFQNFFWGPLEQPNLEWK